MAWKYRSNAQLGVRTPEACLALRRWLKTPPTHVYERGYRYFAEHRVVSARAQADHHVEATVVGGAPYTVRLFLVRDSWRTACSCPMMSDCKHAVAAALAWIEHNGSDFQEAGATQLTPSADDEPTAVAVGGPKRSRLGPVTAQDFLPSRKVSFREKWTPVLEQKLGRTLTDSERHLLGQLSAVFHEFSQWRRMYESSLRAHGFEEAIPREKGVWGQVFEGWWTENSIPVDPWELWQYIAYSLERNGHAVPEALRPMTDTAAVGERLNALELNEDIEVWQRAVQQLGTPAVASPRTAGFVTNVRVRITEQGNLSVETKSQTDKRWKSPTKQWLVSLTSWGPADFERLPAADAALAMTLAFAGRSGEQFTAKYALSESTFASVLASKVASQAVVLPDESPFSIEPERLVPEAVVCADKQDRLEVRLVGPGGNDASAAKLLTLDPEPLYVLNGRVWRGPPELPTRRLPVAALSNAVLMTQLRKLGLKLPEKLHLERRVVPLMPRLRLWIAEGSDVYLPQYICVLLTAASAEPPCEQLWAGVGGWRWVEGKTPPPRRPDDPVLDFDLSKAQEVGSHFAEFGLTWNAWYGAWTRPVTKSFTEDLLAWRERLPADVEIDASSELAAFFKPAMRATIDWSALPADSAHDWFDITVALRVEDTSLTPDEIALLLKSRGKWIRLPKKGWRRLELEGAAPGEAAAGILERLGLTAADVLATGRASSHRLHALQLASEAEAIEARDAALGRALHDRLKMLAAVEPAVVPTSLTATLRPYQQEGFQFLAHLSALGFGGVLADDMGLGKTVQALAWMLHLAAQPRPKRSPLRVLVICPKSVMHGWVAEAARFAPSLTAEVFDPSIAQGRTKGPRSMLLIANYTQLRLQQGWLGEIAWDAVVLDEGQFIKNPDSQSAAAARALKSRHRLVLTGTPIENHLTDLWSLFAFVQPGLLGTQAAFRRQFNEKDPGALDRLHRRVRHFLLRRTKAQAAPDLPPRTEDEIVVDLEPQQRKLYDAELKQARQQLLGIVSDRELDKVRFNILSSLLRLRQICCHPALLDPAHASMDSAKLEALLERVEELREEGHQVLVFSQFVTMLEIIRRRLEAAGIGHLVLTGATENRPELVAQFQSDRTKTVFLLSLKAAGFGLNLTAASYAILYDPWWNPAVEAQAIDRTHRIGQTKPVFAYRLIAADTIEQKIRRLQQEKAELAAAVVQEESLASVLDLESLRQILA